jgi:hypothetical protein
MHHRHHHRRHHRRHHPLTKILEVHTGKTSRGRLVLSFCSPFQDKILAHALNCVDEFGWTDEALAAGAVGAGLPISAKGSWASL